jgi:hypothetical protein
MAASRSISRITSEEQRERERNRRRWRWIWRLEMEMEVILFFVLLLCNGDGGRMVQGINSARFGVFFSHSVPTPLSFHGRACAFKKEMTKTENTKPG